jgi:hypothetical protein
LTVAASYEVTATSRAFPFINHRLFCFCSAGGATGATESAGEAGAEGGTGPLVGREKFAGTSPTFRKVLLCSVAKTSEELKVVTCGRDFDGAISRFSSVREELELPAGETSGK